MTISAGSLRGETKLGNSDSRIVPTLSITFFLEDRVFTSKVFLEDRDLISNYFLEDIKLLSSNFTSREGGTFHSLFFIIERLALEFFHALGKFFQLFSHLRKPADVRVQAFEFVQRLNRNSPPDAWSHNLSRQNAGL